MYLVSEFYDLNNIDKLVSDLEKSDEKIIVITNEQTYNILKLYLSKNNKFLRKIVLLCEPCAFNDVNLFEIKLLENNLEELRYSII